MIFNPYAPVDSRLLQKAKALHDALPTASDGFDHGYYHWMVSRRDQTFPEYTCSVWCDAGGEWHLTVSHDPRDNAFGSFNGAGYAGHTYRRNQGAFGVSIAGMLGASYRDFGPYPITQAGLDHLCAAMAAFCRRYGVQCNVQTQGKFYREAVEHSVMTHAEAARWTPSTSNGIEYPHYYTFRAGGDPDSRWDLNLFSPQGSPPTEADAYVHGSLLRQRAHVIGVHL